MTGQQCCHLLSVQQLLFSGRQANIAATLHSGASLSNGLECNGPNLCNGVLLFVSGNLTSIELLIILPTVRRDPFFLWNPPLTHCHSQNASTSQT